MYYHSSHVQQRGVVTFIVGHALNTALLNVQFSSQTLQLGIRAGAIFESFPRDGAIMRGSNSYILLLDVEGRGRHCGTRLRLEA